MHNLCSGEDGVGNGVSKSHDSRHYIHKLKFFTLFLTASFYKSYLIQVKNRDESPERPPPARQNAGRDRVSDWEKGEDVGEKRVR